MNRKIPDGFKIHGRVMRLGEGRGMSQMLLKKLYNAAQEEHGVTLDSR